MQARELTIENRIPALLWGEGTGPLCIAVHGDMSHKGDDAIAAFAEAATPKGHRVLSFDLPEHGTRTDGAAWPNKVQNAVADLHAVLAHARTLSPCICLFAVSLGAYYSLVAYRDAALEQALFLSPVVDMTRMIENMMGWFGVSAERLQAKGEVPTPLGKTLEWDYYQYTKQNPVRAWAPPTAILYGSADEVSEREAVETFAQTFGAELTVLEGFEHYFHTPEQLAALRAWAGEYL